jgi:hypothetical protein
MEESGGRIKFAAVYRYPVLRQNALEGAARQTAMIFTHRLLSRLHIG